MSYRDTYSRNRQGTSRDRSRDRSPPRRKPKLATKPCKFNCVTCAVSVDSRATYETHLGSKDHKRRNKPLEIYKCKLCNVEVSSAETLQSHYAGAPHRKMMAKSRASASRSRSWRYRPTTPEEKEEIVKLAKKCRMMKCDIKSLQNKYQILREKKIFCMLNHNMKKAANKDDIAA